MKKLAIGGILLILLFEFSGFSSGQNFDYVLGNDYYAVPNIPEPQKGVSFQDPDFHSTLIRITDIQNDIDGGNKAYIQYCRYSPLSSDGRYLLVHTNKFYQIYDLTNNTIIGRAPHVAFDTGEYPYGSTNGGSAEPEYRWDYSGDHPTRLYYRYNTKFYQADILTGESELIRDFKNDFPEIEDFAYIFNDDEGEASADSRYWAFMVMGKYESGMGQTPIYYIFTYDKEQDKIVGILTTRPVASENSYPLGIKPNFVDISPDGRKVLASWGWKSSTTGLSGSIYDGPHVYNLNFTNPIKVGGGTKHSGWAFDYEGNQVFVQSWTGDYITATNVETGEQIKIIHHTDFGGWDVHWHFSRIYNSEIKGWIMMSLYDSDYNEWADNQILMLEIKPKEENPRIWRITHSYGLRGVGGFSSPKAALNWQGNKIFWSSNWNGNSKIEVYQAILPDHWWEDLRGTLADSIPPIISNVTASSITASRATITWTTNEAADSQVEYGLTLGYEYSTPVISNLVRSHNVVLNGLEDSTRYHYRIRSRDYAGNLAISNDYTFITKSESRVIGTERNSQIPIDFDLSQNYPNPFNDSTIIMYAIPVSSISPRTSITVHTTLRIYNSSGQLVRTIVDEDKKTGNYKVTWDGKDDEGKEVTSGVYIYKLKAGYVTLAKKLILLR